MTFFSSLVVEVVVLRKLRVNEVSRVEVVEEGAHVEEVEVDSC